MDHDQMFSITFLGLGMHEENHRCQPRMRHENLALEYDTYIARFLHWNFSLKMKDLFVERNIHMARMAEELALDESNLAKM